MICFILYVNAIIQLKCLSSKVEIKILEELMQFHELKFLEPVKDEHAQSHCIGKIKEIRSI